MLSYNQPTGSEHVQLLGNMRQPKDGFHRKWQYFYKDSQGNNQLLPGNAQSPNTSNLNSNTMQRYLGDFLQQTFSKLTKLYTCVQMLLRNIHMNDDTKQGYCIHMQSEDDRDRVLFLEE